MPDPFLLRRTTIYAYNVYVVFVMCTLYSWFTKHVMFLSPAWPVSHMLDISLTARLKSFFRLAHRKKLESLRTMHESLNLFRLRNAQNAVVKFFRVLYINMTRA